MVKRRIICASLVEFLCANLRYPISLQTQEINSTVGQESQSDMSRVTYSDDICPLRDSDGAKRPSSAVRSM